MIGPGGYPLAEIPPAPSPGMHQPPPGTHQLPQNAHFDRVLHCAYGLLLPYPIREISLRVKGRACSVRSGSRRCSPNAKRIEVSSRLAARWPSAKASAASRNAILASRSWLRVGLRPKLTRRCAIPFWDRAPRSGGLLLRPLFSAESIGADPTTRAARFPRRCRPRARARS